MRIWSTSWRVRDASSAVKKVQSRRCPGKWFFFNRATRKACWKEAESWRNARRVESRRRPGLWYVFDDFMGKSYAQESEIPPVSPSHYFQCGSSARLAPPDLPAPWSFHSYDADSGKVQYRNSRSGELVEQPWDDDAVVEACAEFNSVASADVMPDMMESFKAKGLASFEKFHGLPAGSAHISKVQASSAGLLGWARCGEAWVAYDPNEDGEALA